MDTLGQGVSAVSAILDMRVVWLTPLFLAYFCSSLASADDQPSCDAFPTELSGCSLAPSHLRFTRAVEPPVFSSRSPKLKRRHKSKKQSRVRRSDEENFEVVEEDDFPKPSNNPRHPFANHEEQHASQVQGDWQNFMRTIQPSVLPSRYCPHCRQPLPPDFLPPVDPRMFLPLHTSRYQALPITNPSVPFGPREEFPNSNVNKPHSHAPEELGPFNYRMTGEESETYSPDYFNQTTSMREMKKPPAGLSEVFLESSPSDDSLSSLTKMEIASMLKKTKLHSAEDLTKLLDKKNS